MTLIVGFVLLAAFPSPARVETHTYLAGQDVPRARPRPALPPAPRTRVWKRYGNAGLLPVTIRDDGQKIYLTWSKGQPMPAVFIVNKRGREEMVNGFMRGSDFVIDDVVDHLVFRLDDGRAEAKRVWERSRR